MFSHIDALAHTRAICTCCFFGKVISRTSCLMTTWEDLLLTLHDASCTLCTPNSLVSRLISSRFAHTSPFSTYFHKHISNYFKILFEILKVHCAAPNLWFGWWNLWCGFSRTTSRESERCLHAAVRKSTFGFPMRHCSTMEIATMQSINTHESLSLQGWDSIQRTARVGATRLNIAIWLD